MQTQPTFHTIIHPFTSSFTLPPRHSPFHLVIHPSTSSFPLSPRHSPFRLVIHPFTLSFRRSQNPGSCRCPFCLSFRSAAEESACRPLRVTPSNLEPRTSNLALK